MTTQKSLTTLSKKTYILGKVLKVRDYRQDITGKTLQVKKIQVRYYT